MLKKIAPDKWRHFIAGIIMGGLLQAFLLWIWPVRLGMVTIAVLVLVVVISYGFELFSKITGKGHYDFIDAVASVIGGVLGMVVIIMMFLLRSQASQL